MPDEQTESLRERLVEELVAEGQGQRDSQMPAPPNPNPDGESGPSPSNEVIAAASVLERDPAQTPGDEGTDPGVFDAGGVNAANTDGMTRATGRD